MEGVAGKIRSATPSLLRQERQDQTQKMTGREHTRKTQRNRQDLQILTVSRRDRRVRALDK